MFDEQLGSRFEWLLYHPQPRMSPGRRCLSPSTCSTLRERQARLEDLVTGAELVHAARLVVNNALSRART